MDTFLQIMQFLSNEFLIIGIIGVIITAVFFVINLNRKNNMYRTVDTLIKGFMIVITLDIISCIIVLILQH